MSKRLLEEDKTEEINVKKIKLNNENYFQIIPNETINEIFSFLYPNMIVEGVEKKFFLRYVYLKTIKQIFLPIRMVCKLFQEHVSPYWIQSVKLNDLKTYTEKIQSGIAIMPMNLHIIIIIDKSELYLDLKSIKDFPLQSLEITDKDLEINDIIDDGFKITVPEEGLQLPSSIKELYIDSHLKFTDIASFDSKIYSLSAPIHHFENCISLLNKNLEVANLMHNIKSEVGAKLLPPNLKILNIADYATISKDAIKYLPESLIQINVIISVSALISFMTEININHYIMESCETISNLLDSDEWISVNTIKKVLWNKYSYKNKEIESTSANVCRVSYTNDRKAFLYYLIELDEPNFFKISFNRKRL
jgi:hypothetical protein